jgi:xylulose-5-phosphate/fructose-6-phosphate phosphoketolase
MAAVLDEVVAELKQFGPRRAGDAPGSARQPMIVLQAKTDLPRGDDGLKCEDYWRSHQVPMGDWTSPPT